MVCCQERRDTESVAKSVSQEGSGTEKKTQRNGERGHSSKETCSAAAPSTDGGMKGCTLLPKGCHLQTASATLWALSYSSWRGQASAALSTSAGEEIGSTSRDQLPQGGPWTKVTSVEDIPALCRRTGRQLEAVPSQPPGPEHAAAVDPPCALEGENSASIHSIWYH